MPLSEFDASSVQSYLDTLVSQVAILPVEEKSTSSIDALWHKLSVDARTLINGILKRHDFEGPCPYCGKVHNKSLLVVAKETNAIEEHVEAEIHKVLTCMTDKRQEIVSHYVTERWEKDHVSDWFSANSQRLYGVDADKLGLDTIDPASLFSVIRKIYVDVRMGISCYNAFYDSNLEVGAFVQDMDSQAFFQRFRGLDLPANIHACLREVITRLFGNKKDDTLYSGMKDLVYKALDTWRDVQWDGFIRQMKEANLIDTKNISQLTKQQFFPQMKQDFLNSLIPDSTFVMSLCSQLEGQEITLDRAVSLLTALLSSVFCDDKIFDLFQDYVSSYIRDNFKRPAKVPAYIKKPPTLPPSTRVTEESHGHASAVSAKSQKPLDIVVAKELSPGVESQLRTFLGDQNPPIMVIDDIIDLVKRSYNKCGTEIAKQSFINKVNRLQCGALDYCYEPFFKIVEADGCHCLGDVRIVSVNKQHSHHKEQAYQLSDDAVNLLNALTQIKQINSGKNVQLIETRIQTLINIIVKDMGYLVHSPEVLLATLIVYSEEDSSFPTKLAEILENIVKGTAQAEDFSPGLCYTFGNNRCMVVDGKTIVDIGPL